MLNLETDMKYSTSFLLAVNFLFLQFKNPNMGMRFGERQAKGTRHPPRPEERISLREPSG